MYYIYIFLYPLVILSLPTLPVFLIFPSFSQSPRGLQEAQNILPVSAISCFCPSPLAYFTGEGTLQYRPLFFSVLPLSPCWPLCSLFVLVYVPKTHPCLVRLSHLARSIPLYFSVMDSIPLEAPEVPLELFSGRLVSIYTYQHWFFPLLVLLPTVHFGLSIVLFATSHYSLNLSLFLVLPLACSWFLYVPFRVSFVWLFIHKQKNLFLRTDRACFRTNSVRSLRPVLLDLPCLLCLSFLASGAPGRPTFPPKRLTRLLRPHPLLVPPPCIGPLILSSTGLLPTSCGCARPATICATLTPLAT